MFPPTAVPEGFHSADGKRSVKRAAVIGGVLVGVLQVVLPLVLVGWAIVRSFVGAFSTPHPEIKAPAADEAFVWYTAPVPSDDVFFEETRSLHRIPWAQDGKPATLTTFEGTSRDPMLFAHRGGVGLLGETEVARFADGVLTPRAFDESLEYLSWPLPSPDSPRVVVLARDYDGELDDAYTLSLKTFDGARWDTTWAEHVSLPWGPDTVRAVALPDSVHVFASGADDIVRHAVRGEGAGGLGAWSETPVHAMDWSAAALDGQPVVVALEETDVTTFVKGWRLVEGWKPLFRAEVEFAGAVGAVTLPATGDPGSGELLGVLTDTTLDGVALLTVNADGEKVAQREYSSSTIMGEAVGLIVLSQLAPFALSLLFALLIAASMRRHRVAEFVVGGRSVRYASLTKRGAAKAVDTLIALVVPAAVLAPEFLDGTLNGTLDETRIWVVTLLWTVPLGLGLTALEGARGWTPGKRLLGIEVVGEDLRPPGFRAAFVRGVMTIADGAFSYMVGIVVVALNARWQRVGDQVAHTRVIERDRS